MLVAVREHLWAFGPLWFNRGGLQAPQARQLAQIHLPMPRLAPLAYPTPSHVAVQPMHLAAID
jgi:hypothetical protein